MGQSPSKRAPWEHSHTQIRSEENAIDPDDGNSWKCSGCTLPIFSTPLKIKHGHILHDQCANLPNQLMDHVFHRGQPLQLKEKWDSSTHDDELSCDKCNEKCGTMFYQCYYFSCDLRLDLLCSLQIKILHRSHEHRLMAIRGSASFICGACGTQHQGMLSAPSYFCTACGFWIHKDCASSPNAIRLVVHQHSLFLTYDLPGSSADEGCQCAICGKDILLHLGAYICIKCRYYAHIQCATSDPHKFKPVLIRDAKLADLLHLPMADECSNIVQYMLENTSAGNDHDEAVDDACDDHHHDDNKEDKDEDDDDDDNDDDDDDDDEGEEEEAKEGQDRRLHKHPLILHDEDDDDVDSDDDDGTGHSSSRVCNACVQFISSPPYYSCSQCPDFLLHSSCANLPTKIQHPFHQQHALFLYTKPPKSRLAAGFNCDGCGLLCNGFEYRCRSCTSFNMDVLCALMPPSITHASHGKTHILYMSRNSGSKCSCCNLDLKKISYECTNCRHLKLHAHCALLPTTIHHSFDVHPLKLTTSSNISLTTTINGDGDDEDEDHVDDRQERQQNICEVCEEDIKDKGWHYSCSHCEQSLHVNCIPFLDSLSRTKFGVSVGFNFHDYCGDLTLVRENTIAGYPCNDCENDFSFEDAEPHEFRCAYQCSKCYYRIHYLCALIKRECWWPD